MTEPRPPSRPKVREPAVPRAAKAGAASTGQHPEPRAAERAAASSATAGIAESKPPLAKPSLEKPGSAPRAPLAQPARPAHAGVTPPAWWPQRLPAALYDRLHAYALLTRQDRPVGWLLLLWPTLWGLWLAADGVPPWWLLVVFVLGVVAMRSAGCAINDWADRGLDAKVSRTRERPLVSGRVSPREALTVCAVLLALCAALVLSTNAKTVALAAVAAALALTYPFLKRYTYVPQLGLGLAFSMGIPMAATAVTGAWPGPLIWLAFLGNLLWTVAYDTLYAMVDREDDLRAGARSTAILFGDLDLIALGVLLGSFVTAMALLGHRAEFGGWYAAGLVVAAGWSAWTLWLARGRDPASCFKAFVLSHWTGAAIFIGLALDRALSG